jgi:hypothetical protein
LSSQTQPFPLPSVEMKNMVNLNNILTHITNARETEMGEKRIFHLSFKETYPFKMSVARKHDNQKPLFSGSGNTLMKQLQFQGNMKSDC